MTACPRILLLSCSIVLVPALALAVAGCEKQEVQKVSPRSEKKVSLPAKPELKPPQYKYSHGDGTMTVEGLLRNARDFFGKPVKVRGRVAELRVCETPPPYTEEEIAKAKEIHERRVRLARMQGKPAPKFELAPPLPKRTCRPRPQAFLVDDGGNHSFRLLVAGSMASQLRELELNRAVDLEAQFDMYSPDHYYLSQEGLLYLPDLPKYKDKVDHTDLD